MIQSIFFIINDINMLHVKIKFLGSFVAYLLEQLGVKLFGWRQFILMG